MFSHALCAIPHILNHSPTLLSWTRGRRNSHDLCRCRHYCVCGLAEAKEQVRVVEFCGNLPGINLSCFLFSPIIRQTKKNHHHHHHLRSRNELKKSPLVLTPMKPGVNKGRHNEMRDTIRRVNALVSLHIACTSGEPTFFKINSLFISTLFPSFSLSAPPAHPVLYHFVVSNRMVWEP